MAKGPVAGERAPPWRAGVRPSLLLIWPVVFSAWKPGGHLYLLELLWDARFLPEHRRRRRKEIVLLSPSELLSL